MNDATDMANTLRSLGFEVAVLFDASQPAMDEAIYEFGVQLRSNGGLGLFYYAGHGIEVDGGNYLIPVDAAIRAEDEVRFKSIAVDQVLAKMESAGNEANLVFLDACRDNPLPPTARSSSSGRGLSVVQAVTGSLIVYATAPGQVAQDGQGRNGVFTGALLSHIGTPGMDVETMLRRVRGAVLAATGGKQVPWSSSSLTGAVYLTGASPDAGQPIVQTTGGEPDFAPLDVGYGQNRFFWAKPLGHGEASSRIYIIGSPDDPAREVELVDESRLGVRDAGEGKRWSARYVNGGTAFFLTGQTSDAGTDLFFTRFADYRPVNLSSDGGRWYEALRDFAQESQRVLFTATNHPERETRVVVTDTAARFYADAPAPEGDMVNALWADAAGERVWVITRSGAHTVLISSGVPEETWTNASPEDDWRREFTFETATESTYTRVLDFDRSTGRVLMQKGVEVYLVDLRQEQAEPVDVTELWSDSPQSGGVLRRAYWNESATSFVFEFGWYDHWGEGEPPEPFVGVYDVATGRTRLFAPGATRPFWFSEDEVGYFRNNPEAGEAGELHLLKANVHGRGEVVLARYEPNEYLRLTGWHIDDDFWWGRACPHVYVVDQHGSLSYIGETIPNAVGSLFRTTHRMPLPGAGSVLIREELPETSFLFSVELRDAAGELPVSVSGSFGTLPGVPYVLQQGDWVDLTPLRSPVGQVELVTDGFYQPEVP